MHYVHGLKQLRCALIGLAYTSINGRSSISHATKVLETYIITRLVPNEDHHWIESAVLTLTWLMATSDSAPTSPRDVRPAFDRIQQAWNQTLGQEVARAAIIVRLGYNGAL